MAENTIYCLDPSNIELREGETAEIKISPSPEKGKTVKWKSESEENVSIKTIDNDNSTALVLGLKADTCSNITATIDGVATEKCQVQVYNAVYTINKDHVTLKVDETIPVNDSSQRLCFMINDKCQKENVTWKSNNEDIIKIVENELIPCNIGSTTVSASYNGKSATCSVKVLPPFTLNKYATTILLGGTDTLQAIKNLNDSNTSLAIKWDNSNTTSVTLPNSGDDSITITGSAKGSAVITATCTIGTITYYESCNVTVASNQLDAIIERIDDVIPQADDTYKGYSLGITFKTSKDTSSPKQLAQGKEVNFAIGDKAVSILLTSIHLHKEMYKPGCLEVTMETNAELADFNGLVTLRYQSEDSSVPQYTVADTYHIFEKKKRGRYVTLKAYSVDKFLTIDKFSQAFTGKKLIEDIVNATLKNYENSKSKIRVFCDNVTRVENGYSDIANLRHLKSVSTTASTTEPSLPYNVQFEESFYDFLVRICNRNGEFLYVEDNKLHIGINIPEKSSVKAIYEYESNGSATGYEIEYTEEEESCDYTTISNKKQFPEEYYKPVRKKDDDFAKNEDYYIGGALSLSLIKPIVESPHIMDAIPQTTMACGAIFGLSEMFKKQANEDFKEAFGDYTQDDVYQFVDGNDFGNQFYAEILKNEKLAEREKLIVTSSTYKHHLLGDTVKVDDKFYVVYQVRGGAKIMDGVIESQDIKRYKEEFEMVLIPYIGKETESDENITSSPYPIPLPRKNTIKPSPQRAIVSANKDPMRLGRVRVLFEWQDSEDSGNASPWINMASPMASQESGFMFLPAKGDTVLVDFVDGNVEHPYVVGSFYREDRLPSFHASTQNGPLVKSITSANGHHLTFTDLPGKRFGANLWPFSYFAKFGYLDNLSIAKEDNKLGGGFELADYYGFYSITGSTHERKVSIKSPFGDVSIDAFQGITISAPSGNIKIEGKNVDIIARNNLSITSGTNIAQPRWGSRDAMDYNKDNDSKGTTIRKVAKYLGIDHMLAPWIVGVGRGILDLSLYRTWLEVLFRPVGGSLLIKSHRFMKLEAGKGRTAIHTSFAKHEVGQDSGDKVRFKNAVKWFFSSSFVGKASKDQTMADIVAYKADIIRDCKLINGIYCVGGKLDKLFQEIQQCAVSTPPVPRRYLQEQIKKVSSGDCHLRTANDIYKEIEGDLKTIKQEWGEDEVNRRITEIKNWINNLRVELNGNPVRITNGTGKPTENPLDQLHVQQKLYEYIYQRKRNDIKDLVTIDETVPDGNRNGDYNAETLKDKINIKHPDMNHRHLKKTIGILAKATGLSGALDDHTWSKNDEGGILISAHKDAMYKITKEGQLKGYVPEIDAAWQNFLIKQLMSVPGDEVLGVVQNQQPNQGQDAAAPPHPQAPTAPQQQPTE